MEARLHHLARDYERLTKPLLISITSPLPA
jgi:hypothetical protein